MIDPPSKIQNPKSRIAAVVLTRDEERHIGACLDLLAWADRRVVFDSFSTDRTCEIALKHGAEVMQHPFSNYAAQRNAAMESLDADWIFFVDADERGTPELAEEIRAVIVQERQNIAGWYVPRRNYIFGKLTSGAGYWPDYQMRLLKRGLARYERPASEIAELQGRSDYLKNPLIHYNYESVAQFHEKQTFRIDFEAMNLYRQGVKSKFYTPYYMSVRHFWWRFVMLKGYQDGVHGLHLSYLLAYYFGYRYYKRLRQIRRSSTEKPQNPPEV